MIRDSCYTTTAERCIGLPRHGARPVAAGESAASVSCEYQDAGVQVRRPGWFVFMAVPLLQRSFQKLLAGLELPRLKAVYRLAAKRSRGVVAKFSKLLGEPSLRAECSRSAAPLMLLVWRGLL